VAARHQASTAGGTITNEPSRGFSRQPFVVWVVTAMSRPQVRRVRPSEARAASRRESMVTVLIAGASNLAVAVAKAVGGLVSGSAALQAEAAHSVADTVTEVFLYVANRRGRRGPDARHPFGHGRETYVWAFLGAVATFVAGALFSLTLGVDTLVRGESRGPVSILYRMRATVPRWTTRPTRRRLNDTARRVSRRVRAVAAVLGVPLSVVILLCNQPD
jgi:hypothetical protein